MANHQRDILNFKRFVWGRLPVRKYLCGHNMAFDIAAVIVQEWPCEAIDISKSGETVEVKALEKLVASCKRHLALVYGHPEWDAWAETATYLIWQASWITLRWYRSDEKSAAAMKKWRSKWRYGRT